MQTFKSPAVLFYSALAGRELLNVGPSSPGGSDEFGIVPLGMPLIAGPALLTALLVLVDTVGRSVYAGLAAGQSGLGRTGVLECRSGSRAGWACRDYAAYRRLSRSSSPRLRSA